MLNDEQESGIPNDTGEIVESERAEVSDEVVGLADVLRQMGNTYRTNPVVAVRGQAFIKYLHRSVGTQLEARLTRFARRRGITVRYEAKILGSTKSKDVDVAVIDPDNGPLVIIGVRSQMSSSCQRTDDRADVLQCSNTAMP